MKNIIIVWLVLVVGVLVSCKKEPYTDFEYMEEVQDVVYLNKQELMNRLGQGANKALIAVLPDKKLKVVTLHYRTKDPAGNDIIASGTVTFPTAMPDFQERGSVLAVHFTMGADAQVPSNKKASHESMFALFGYVVVAPDYIGYGTTKDKVHPYHHCENTGRVSTDLLLAAKEYFASANLRFPRNVSIIGYSEGGYASMASLKYLEQKRPGWIQVQQVLAGAGAYDLLASYDDFIKTKYSSQPGTIPMLMLGLNYGDALGLDFSKLFLEPLLSSYPEWILSKKYSTDEISEKIGQTDITKFLAPEVFDTTQTNTRSFRESLRRNSVVEWTPRAPIVLIHGDKDTIVPFVNTESAYNKLKQRGCNVSLYVVRGKDHKPAGNDFYTYCLLRLITNAGTRSGDAVGITPEFQPTVDYIQSLGRPVIENY